MLPCNQHCQTHAGEVTIQRGQNSVAHLAMGITQYRLAKSICVPQRRIGEIIAGNRSITVDTGLRLSRFFGLSDSFWTRLQLDFDIDIDIEKAKQILADILPGIHPFKSDCSPFNSEHPF